MNSGDLIKLASYKNDNDIYVLQLHYCAGVDLPSKKDVSTEKGLNQCLEIVKFIGSYFVDDNEIIKKCVLNSRNLYITATTNEGNQNIVGCLNYCVLPNKGIFVNWLVISDGEVSKHLYGGLIQFQCGNNDKWH